MASTFALSVLALSSMATARPQEFNSLHAQIVGGTEASAGEFPYIVSIQQDSFGHFCGGVLISANTVLSAAHCTFQDSAGKKPLDPATVSVRVGSLQTKSGGVTSRITKIVAHPSYVANITDNDVSVWQLTTPINAGANSTTIGFATLPEQDSDPAANSTTTTAGWGLTSEDSTSIPTDLLKVSVPVVDRATCDADYAVDGLSITDNMFCAASSGKDSCSGDSGGPIIAGTSGSNLIGVVSWGVGCAQAEFPGVYTRIGKFVTWINENKF